jgi:cyclic beta-1,2-glucan synthetase
VTSAQQVALAVAFLPHQAWISADAIVRTLWRCSSAGGSCSSGRPPRRRTRSEPARPRAPWGTMWPAVALALGDLVGGSGARARRCRGRRGRRRASGSSCARSCRSSASGCVARPSRTRSARRQCGRSDPPLRTPQREAEALRYALPALALLRPLRDRGDELARAGQLPGGPAPVVAMRTSPTNIGLQLLATVSAHDLGFITLEDMVRRGSSGRSHRLERMRVPRPLLQLVRPARPAGAGARLCLDRGQRQPRRCGT